MLKLDEIVRQIDKLFEEKKGPQAEELMKACMVQAVKEEDDQALLTLLNELIGYYRETSQTEASFRLADQALVLLGQMGLEGTVPYATTLLNIANAYRAGGRLSDSLIYYEKTKKIYREKLPAQDMLMASLYNNMSLLFQEQEEYGKAKESLLNALSIVKHHIDAYFELAVTYANLASTCLALNEDEEACGYFGEAVAIFEAHGIEDAHYSAALSSLGTYYYKKRQWEKAASYFEKAMECMRKSLGENEYYYRLKENLEACKKADEGLLNGLFLCKKYYEEMVAPMIREQFPEYEDVIAVGLSGEGSDCFGFDDGLSRDHDWGPDLCIWITEETDRLIGQALRDAYAKLPEEYMGYRRNPSLQGVARRGVQTIGQFYSRLLGEQEWEQQAIALQGRDFWLGVTDSSLAASINGAVFRDDQGIFSGVRKKLSEGYPERIRYLKLAQAVAGFSQAGQYNFIRMYRRKELVSCQMLLGDCLKEAARLCYYMENCYPPHDKWLLKGLGKFTDYQETIELLRQVAMEGAHVLASKEPCSDAAPVLAAIEKLAGWLADRLYGLGYISDTDPYLDHHTEELLKKAKLSDLKDVSLVEEIVKLEFAAFDNVRNVGGRASCQDDWFTFSIMRKSQYLTWDREMLIQYLYDFQSALSKGRNLIEEKYGRMMESTAPDEYEKLKIYLPKIDPAPKAIIEAIVEIQVGWMEAFEAQYPTLAGNARSIHTMQDTLENTSYETYLRGELSTYSDKMLELYGRYVVNCAKKGENLACAIMKESVVMYGYGSLEEAEEQMRKLRVR